jgi:hypothetical protein
MVNGYEAGKTGTKQGKKNTRPPTIVVLELFVRGGVGIGGGTGRNVSVGGQVDERNCSRRHMPSELGLLCRASAVPLLPQDTSGGAYKTYMPRQASPIPLLPDAPSLLHPTPSPPFQQVSFPSL